MSDTEKVCESVLAGLRACPLDAAVLHPVTPRQLLVLSDAALSGHPCAPFNATGLGPIQ